MVGERGEGDQNGITDNTDNCPKCVPIWAKCMLRGHEIKYLTPSPLVRIVCRPTTKPSKWRQPAPRYAPKSHGHPGISDNQLMDQRNPLLMIYIPRAAEEDSTNYTLQSGCHINGPRVHRVELGHNFIYHCCSIGTLSPIMQANLT